MKGLSSGSSLESPLVIKTSGGAGAGDLTPSSSPAPTQLVRTRGMHDQHATLVPYDASGPSLKPFQSSCLPCLEILCVGVLVDCRRHQ